MQVHTVRRKPERSRSFSRHIAFLIRTRRAARRPFTDPTVSTTTTSWPGRTAPALPGRTDVLPTGDMTGFPVPVFPLTEVRPEDIVDEKVGDAVGELVTRCLQKGQDDRPVRLVARLLVGYAVGPSRDASPRYHGHVPPSNKREGFSPHDDDTFPVDDT
eukprot:g48022.t1